MPNGTYESIKKFYDTLPLKTHFNCDWCGKHMVSDSALREHIERHILERSPFITLELQLAWYN